MSTIPNPYERFFMRIGHARWFAWFGRRILTPLDNAALGHRLAPTTFGTHFPLCYLTARGERTGKPHTVPLLYVEHGEAYAVAATNFGAQRAPAWSRNLDANPEASLRVDERNFPVAARSASAAEAGTLWERFDAMWPPFATYRRRAGRVVPIHILEHAEDE
jgi:deazaflavin-dependent oxidoreductase (nitroreductase family)